MRDEDNKIETQKQIASIRQVREGNKRCGYTNEGLCEIFGEGDGGND